MTAIDNDRPMVELVKVSKIYPPDVVALDNVSFAVAKGEIVFLIGMSGAGKTSLLNLICSIERPTKGVVEVAGRDLSRLTTAGIQRLRQKIGVAYQDFKLLPHLTVAQNVAMPMEVAYQKTAAIRRRVEELLGKLNLADKKHKRTDRLSRGEQQRVALARAAANAPPLLLADEPTGNLDSATSALVMELFEEIHSAGATIIIATHDEKIFRDTPHRVLDLGDHRQRPRGRLELEDMAI